MFWTLELAHHLDDAPWPCTKAELLDYAFRTGAPTEVIENLQTLDDNEEVYENMEEIWPDFPASNEFYYSDEDEY